MRPGRPGRADIHGPKPYKFIGFGDIHGPKPYKCIGFGDIHDPNPYEFIGFGDMAISLHIAGSAKVGDSAGEAG